MNFYGDLQYVVEIDVLKCRYTYIIDCRFSIRYKLHTKFNS